MSRTIGVIGLGSIGMRHAKNLRDMGHHVWGYDPDMKKRLELGFEYGASKIEHMKTADALVIASPTADHYSHVLLVADFGKPFLVEKPVSDTPFRIPDIDKSITMVGYNLRFHGCVKKAKEWLDSNKIGRPQWANFTLGQYSEKPPYLRDGVILNWSHEIDLALHLLGPIHNELINSVTHLTDGKDDMTDITVIHQPNGCQTTIHLDYLSDPEIRRFRIQGNLGIIEVDLVRFTADLYCAEPTESFRWKDHTWNDTYIEEMQAFLDRCDGKETIGCTGQEGLDILKICLEVRKQAGLK